MTPLIVLLLGLGATAAASEATSEFRRRDQLDALRRRLGLWPAHPTAHLGSIANRLQYIDKTFGLEYAMLAQKIALLMGEPTYHHMVRDESGLAPMLPWLAWRLWKEDAPQLRRVLEAPSFHPLEPVEGMPGLKPIDYGKDQAWSDIARLIDWFEGDRPSLFEFTWDEALADEARWFPSSLGTWDGKDWDVSPGKIVYRFLTDEEGTWTVQLMSDSADEVAALGALHIDSRTFNTHSDSLYVLRDPQGEPRAVWMVGRYETPYRIQGEWGNSSWDWQEAGEEELLGRVAEFSRHQWPEPSQWGDPVLAFMSVDEEGATALLDSSPELVSYERTEGVGSLLDRYAWDWIGGKFLEHWAELANAEPGHFDDLYPNTAGHQGPTRRLLKWMATGKWDEELAYEFITDDEELPSILHHYQYGTEQDPQADVTTSSGEHDQVMPYEIKVWDVYRHPDGPELEVKVQIIVFYDSEGRSWVVASQQAAQFRPDPADPSSWLTANDFIDFEFLPLVEQTRGGYRQIDTSTYRKIEDYRGPFEQHEWTNSIDYALREAWEKFTEALNEADIEDENWRTYFKASDLIEPRPELEVQDVFEAVELLQ